MPTICTFFGILIRMYFRDHAPPHFHAEYGGEEVEIDLQTLQVLNGKISRRALKLVLQWARIHQQELLENWEKARRQETLHQVEPLL